MWIQTDKQQIEQLKEALQRYVAVYGKTQLQADGLYTTAELMSKFGIMALPKNSVVVDKEYLKKELQGLELQTRKETAKEIFTKLIEVANNPHAKGKLSIACLIAWATEYGVEVEE